MLTTKAAEYYNHNSVSLFRLLQTFCDSRSWSGMRLSKISTSFPYLRAFSFFWRKYLFSAHINRKLLFWSGAEFNIVNGLSFFRKQDQMIAEQLHLFHYSECRQVSFQKNLFLIVSSGRRYPTSTNFYPAAVSSFGRNCPFRVFCFLFGFVCIWTFYTGYGALSQKASWKQLLSPILRPCTAGIRSARGPFPDLAAIKHNIHIPLRISSTRNPALSYIWASSQILNSSLP